MKLNRIAIGVLGFAGSTLLLSSNSAHAQQQSASAAAFLEEVVVTARRREENLEELPLSIQAISADAMQAQGIYNMEQISDFVPNVVLTEDQRKNDTRMYIRGIGGGFSNPAQVFGVGMYVDGHYMSGSLGAFLSTLDVERVEILRGPQGTLFGKNTTGGAVSWVSAKPGPEFDSYVTVRAGDYGQQDVRAMVNVPLADNVFFRGNYASEINDGYYFNRFFNQPTGGTDQESVGLALRWELGEDWTIDARAALARDRDDNQGGQCRPRPNPRTYNLLIGAADGGTPSNPGTFTGPDLVLGTADDVVYMGPGPFAEYGVNRWGSANDDSSLRPPSAGGPLVGGSNMRVDALYPGAAATLANSCWEDANSGDVYQTYQDALTYSHVDNDMFTLDATWAPGEWGAFEDASLQIKGAWRYTSYNYYQDRDFGPGIIDHIGNNPKGSRGIARWTDEFELIFNGQLGERMNLTTGLYWFDDLAQAGNATCLSDWIAAWDPDAGPINPATGAPEGTINGMHDDDILCEPEGGTFFHRLPDSAGDRRSATNAGRTTGLSTAVYAHLVYNLAENWDLAAGARWMQDDRGQAHIEYPTQRGTCTHNNPGDPSPLGFCDAVYLMNRGTIIDRGIHANVSASFTEVTPTLSLTRHLTPGDVLESGIVYATMSEGYLTGAFNDELNPNNPGFSADQRQNVLDIIPYGPENVTNYELGFKGTLLDGRLRLAAAVFYMDYTDKQETIEVDNGDGRFGPDPAVEYTRNAADVDITGVELEVRASPWTGGFVSLDVGVLNSEYSNFMVPDLDNIGGPLVDVSNSSIANRTPDWTVTGTVEHAFELANGALLTPQLGVYTQANFEWLSGLDVGERSPHCHQDSYAKWRARMTYEPSDGSWQAALYGYNITDERILLRCGSNRGGTYKTLHQAPAWWGAEFTMRFGGG